jgi:hypothetical protein
VLSFWTTFGSAAIAVYGTRLEESLTRDGGLVEAAACVLLPVAVVAQCLGCAYSPAQIIPSRAQTRAFERYVEMLRSIEQEKGEVLTIGYGHITSARHFHQAGIIDVITVEHEVPPEVLAAFRAQRFAAVVIDVVDDLWMPIHAEINHELFYVVSANYAITRRVDGMGAPPQGWPARPLWMMTPREQRLDEHDHLLLVRQSMREMNLAQIGQPFDADHISELTEGLGRVSEQALRAILDAPAPPPPAPPAPDSSAKAEPAKDGPANEVQ